MTMGGEDASPALHAPHRLGSCLCSYWFLQNPPSLVPLPHQPPPLPWAPLGVPLRASDAQAWGAGGGGWDAGLSGGAGRFGPTGVSAAVRGPALSAQQAYEQFATSGGAAAAAGTPTQAAEYVLPTLEVVHAVFLLVTTQVRAPQGQHSALPSLQTYSPHHPSRTPPPRLLCRCATARSCRASRARCSRRAGGARSPAWRPSPSRVTPRPSPRRAQRPPHLWAAGRSCRACSACRSCGASSCRWGAAGEREEGGGGGRSDVLTAYGAVAQPLPHIRPPPLPRVSARLLVRARQPRAAPHGGGHASCPPIARRPARRRLERRAIPRRRGRVARRADAVARAPPPQARRRDAPCRVARLPLRRGCG